MNRFITLLLLGVVAVAMLLVFFVHMNNTSGNNRPEPVIEGAPAIVEPAQNLNNTAPATPESNAGAPLPPAGGDTATEPAQEQPTAPPSGTAAQPGKPASPAQPAAPEQPSIQTRPQATGTATVQQSSGKIVSLGLHFRNQGMYISIEGDSPLPAKYFVLPDPERLVIDLPGSWQGLKTPAIPSNNLVKSIRIGRQGNADRLVLDLHSPLKTHEIQRINDKKVEIYFAQ